MICIHGVSSGRWCRQCQGRDPTAGEFAEFLRQNELAELRVKLVAAEAQLVVEKEWTAAFKKDAAATAQYEDERNAALAQVASLTIERDNTEASYCVTRDALETERKTYRAQMASLTAALRELDAYNETDPRGVQVGITLMIRAALSGAPSDYLETYGVRCAKAGVESVMERVIAILQEGKRIHLIDLAHMETELSALVKSVKP